MSSAEPMLLEAQRSTRRLGERAANSIALLGALQMLVRALGFITLIVLARVLAPDDFGIVALATTIIGVLDVLTNVQVGAAIIRSNNLTTDHLDTAFTLNLLRGVLTAAILALGARPLASFLDAPALELILYVLTIPSILGAISNPYFILFGRNLDFGREAWRRISATLLGSLASIAIALVFRTYWALVAAVIVQSLVTAILSYWKVPGRPRWSLAKAHELLGFGGWMLAQSMLSYLALRAEYFYIGKVMDTRTLGNYHLGNQINMATTGEVVPTLSRALFPAFSMMQDGPKRTRRSYLHVQALCLAISMPIGFGLAMLAEPMVLLLFGRGWEGAVLVVQFIAPIQAIQTLGAGVDVVAMALNRPRALAGRQLINILVRTALIAIGFWLWALPGLLAGRVASGLVFTVYSLTLAANLTNGRFWDPLIQCWRSILALLAMLAALWALPEPEWHQLSFLQLLSTTSLFIAVGGVIYCGSHLLLWRLAGRPEGVEVTLLTQVSRLARRLPRTG